MSTAASPARAAAPGLRPTWGRSILGAVLGVVAGGLASAAVIGLAVVAAWRVSEDPVEDAIADGLAPLSVVALAPVALAVAVDAACRREAFWLVTGRRPTWGTSVVIALIAPAAAVGIGWRGAVVAWVLGASIVLLRRCAEPGPAPPRWFAARSRVAAVVALLGATAVALAGLAALQIGTPAMSLAAIGPPESTGRASRTLVLSNRMLAGVTVLGIEGPARDTVRLVGRSVPFALPRGGGTSVSVEPVPGCRGSTTISVVVVRFRVLGIERVSRVPLPGEMRVRCQPG